ncbi:putative protein [hydrothermal vent metagenome]|uniref:Uncharacterized protein n=1 Tax=hydrothermal vent metagenome TaxID=652676 RepID=A0A1W1C121_9ZZZZ
MAYERGMLKQFGDEAETIGTKYLEDLGYSIIERNFYARKLGEIDIIAKRDGILHFIEVKSANADFDPIYNLTPRKLKRVIDSTHYYLKSKNLDVEFSIDALIIRQGSVELIENITI